MSSNSHAQYIPNIWKEGWSFICAVGWKIIITLFMIICVGVWAGVVPFEPCKMCLKEFVADIDVYDVWALV